MSRIYVCGLDNMPSLVERLRPERLISLLPDVDQPPTPPGIAPKDHLRLLVDDVDSAALSDCPPRPAHIRSLVRFLRDTDGRSVLIHCRAGVSRSPAAALIALALDAPGREDEAAALLREAGPHAQPNRLMIELADRALRRGGRLVAARDAMSMPRFIETCGFIELPRTLAPGRRRSLDGRDRAV